MGVFARRKNALAAQRQAEADMPGAYQSEYKDRINSTLDALGSEQSSAALDRLTDEAYQQYRQRNTGFARGAMENAAAQTAALSGGYGSSYAQSAAKQQFQQEMGELDNALPSVRQEALNRYQTRQSGLAQMLNALQNQEATAQTEYNGKVADAQNWRDYTQSRSQQAQQEVSDFWNNLWNDVKLAGSTLKTGYDAYRGYRQQDWENAFALRQYEDSVARNDRSDALTAYQQALYAKQQGADSLSQAILSQAGLSSDLLDSYTGAPITRADQASVISTAASLAAAGNDEASASLLRLYGMDPSAVGNYSTVAGRQLSTTLAKSAATRAGSSRGSSRSTSDGWTNSQLMSVAKSFSDMEEDDPLYDTYQQILMDAGWLSQSAAAGSTSSTGGTDGSTGSSGSSGSLQEKVSAPRMPTTRAGMAQRQALQWASEGKSEDQIMDGLLGQKLSDDEIYNALKALR